MLLPVWYNLIQELLHKSRIAKGRLCLRKWQKTKLFSHPLINFVGFCVSGFSGISHLRHFHFNETTLTAYKPFHNYSDGYSLTWDIPWSQAFNELFPRYMNSKFQVILYYFLFVTCQRNCVTHALKLGSIPERLTWTWFINNKSVKRIFCILLHRIKCRFKQNC